LLSKFAIFVVVNSLNYKIMKKVVKSGAFQIVVMAKKKLPLSAIKQEEL
jgi:hypothetical protein